jgi:hypothetical protein
LVIGGRAPPQPISWSTSPTAYQPNRPTYVEPPPQDSAYEQPFKPILEPQQPPHRNEPSVPERPNNPNNPASRPSAPENPFSDFGEIKPIPALEPTDSPTSGPLHESCLECICQVFISLISHLK